MQQPLRFGTFIGPLHDPAHNPTLAIRRDLELIQWLDQLGYDEAWVGEHHSNGYETIPSPEIFLAAAAERTKRIKLGTGVVSLPVPPPVPRRRPDGVPRPPHPGPHDLRRRPRGVPVRRLHDGARLRQDAGPRWPRRWRRSSACSPRTSR